MLRFCDKEVISIEYESIVRNENIRYQLLEYFLADHLDDIICVSEEGRYLGNITYDTLLRSECAERAISKDCLYLDKNIWKNARDYFGFRQKGSFSYELLPVVDQDCRLVCFAYQDFDANRELRMLRELQERPLAKQFKDIYSEYECVKIHGFHELAFFFAKYLAGQGISVQVEGDMWEAFFISEDKECLDYRRLDVYAEGVNGNAADWMESLIRTVSVEFECIDKIYEENIKAGIIKNADITCGELIDFLKDKSEIVILGTDIEAQDVFEYLRGKGIDICCFVYDQHDEITGEWLLGKPIVSETEARKRYRDAAFLDVQMKGSAWGCGKTDIYEYFGFKRNEQYFLIKDYIELHGNGLKNILHNQNVVLLGDFYLCERLADYFCTNQILGKGELKYGYMKQNRINYGIKGTENWQLNAGTLYLIVLPEYYNNELWKKQEKKKREIISFFTQNGISNYTNYFSHMESFIYIEKETKNKYQIEHIYPKRIVLGSIDCKCGNTFVRGLLDGHPSILLMDWSYLNENLFWICVRLSGKCADEMILSLREIYMNEWTGWKIDIEKFIEKLSRLLIWRRNYTSQELFSAFHIAYSYAYGADIERMGDKIIYWEPHQTPRRVVEQYAVWLGTECCPCDILNVVRNIYGNNGSYIKSILNGNWGRGKLNAYLEALSYPNIGRCDYDNCKRVVMKFEDIKCSPRKSLYKLCIDWGIPWSESLMATTYHGAEWVFYNEKENIQDFDLTPVYNKYEEYFSEFDRFRLALICAPWQKRYGYEYVDISKFTRRELQEMFLKEFRFEQDIHFKNKMIGLLYKIEIQNEIRKRLQNVRMIQE